jgi:hypothetical protein
VISIATTTGFTNNFDYNSWSPAANMIIILLMLIGGLRWCDSRGIGHPRALASQVRSQGMNTCFILKLEIHKDGRYNRFRRRMISVLFSP